ncbi:MAG: terminase small subunit [Desulfobacterales bacterium]|jgi:hypothetical protein|nr:terminase small subunit [Desulfobacterales bacterium]
MADNLTIKQEKFCAKYIESGDASNAYRFAYSTERMKPDTVNRSAFELLHTPKISARIDQLKQKMLDKLMVSPEKTLRRLMQGQEFDIRRLYHDDGRLKLPNEMDEDTAKAIVGVKYDKDGALLEYKIIDVKGCAELIGKHLKLFVDKTEHSVDPNDPFMRRLLEIDGSSRNLPSPVGDDDH